MKRALDRVGAVDHAIIDGNPIRDIDMGPHTCIVRGDATAYTIAAASVVGKVLRDRLMSKLALRYPGYGWEQNAGYPTRDHREAIHRPGITPPHRRSFGTVRILSHLTRSLDFEDVGVDFDLDGLQQYLVATPISVETF